MELLKISLVSGIKVCNEEIVKVSREIDKLWEDSLKEYDPREYKKILNQIELKKMNRNYFYGQLDAQKEILEKINELEYKEQQEFEEMLKGVPTNLNIGLVKAELPF